MEAKKCQCGMEAEAGLNECQACFLKRVRAVQAKIDDLAVAFREMDWEAIHDDEVKRKW